MATQAIDDSVIPMQDNLSEGETVSKKQKSSPSHYLWAILIARIYAVFPLICPACGGQMKIIAFIREKPVINGFLKSIEEPTTPPSWIALMTIK